VADGSKGKPQASEVILQAGINLVHNPGKPILWFDGKGIVL